MSDSPMAILERAISDVGHWSWWTGEPTKSIQLEFSGVQLWFPPMAEGQPPSGKVALRFRSPSHVLFMSRTSDPSLNCDDWPTRFKGDEIGSFSVGYDTFTLTDAQMASSLIATLTHGIQMIGKPPQKTDFEGSNAWIVLWAGPVGIVVVAKEMEIFSHHGSVSFDEVETASEKWWEYWREYWNKKDSDTPLPRDYACEVTIPAGSE